MTFAAAGALALLGCRGSDEPRGEPADPGRWEVRDGFIRDPEGRSALLRGVNLANAHKAKPYLGFHQPEDFARVRSEWGMNALRFLVTWAAIEPSPGEYDVAYLDAVAERLEWAREAGLLVVLDMHQDVYGEGFGGDGAPRWTCDEANYAAHEPTSPWFLNYASQPVIDCFDAFWASSELRAHYVEAWRRLAHRVAENPAVIGIDPMNEPYWGSLSTLSFEREVLQPFYEEVTRAVRGEAPDWLSFAEPFAGRNLGLATTLEPFELPGVVYAPHVYDASAESGNGFTDGSRNALMLKLDALAEDAARLGTPLWLGEYGGQAADPGIYAYMDTVYDAAARHVAGSMYWAYDRDDGYGLLDADGNEKPELLAAVVRPYPLRVAGEPLEVDFDDVTRTFTLRWKPDAALDAATLVAVPQRVYPQGYRVECSGCEHRELPGGLEVTAGGGELTLSP